MAANDWIARVAAGALDRFDDCMSVLGLSNGKRQGAEYLCLNPRRPDKSPGSFSINATTGEWGDFAIGAAGRDLVSLAAYLWDEANGEAGRKLADHFGIPVPARKEGPPRDPKDSGKEKASAEPLKPHSGPDSRPAEPPAANSAGEIVMPVPFDAPPIPKAHPRLGAPARQWEYRDTAGRLLFLVCRFEPAGGGKDIRPLSLRRMPSGKLDWKWLGAAPLRPLYGLDRLTARPDAPVMICEGEKAADAADLLFPDYVATTSPNGAKAADKADWSVLAGRRCTLFADADEAGESYAAEVCKRLHAIDAEEVRRVNAGLFLALPDGTRRNVLPEGWDAADAVAEGFTAAAIAQAVASGTELLAPIGEELTRGTANDDGGEPAKVRSHCYLGKGGVYYVGVDKNGNETPPAWVCAPLEVLALVRDPHNKGWGKLVEFRDPDETVHREVIDDGLLSGEGADLERLLRRAGLQIAPGGRLRLLNYLITARPKQRARVATRTGWHENDAGRVFVLPDRAIGDAGEVWLFADGATAADYRERASLEEWQQEIASLCVGNSRLVFAVSLAFAAPLVDIVGGESGGFHFSGESGDGKTTALRVAASVCGGADYLRQWRTSDNSMEYLAQQHCDAPLLMDELAQINAKILGDTIYMMGNSSGKSRSRAQGGLRETLKWRILFLSSGEVGLAAHVASVGLSATAGMEGRMAEIPARVSDDPPGIYEDLHGEASPKALSTRLNLAAKKYHGTAFPAFLAELVKRDPDEVRDTLLKARKLFADRFVAAAAGNQVARVADRCALIGAAGELATSWGITGWAKGESMRQAGACFTAWLEHRGGDGNQEEKAMLWAVRGFLEKHGEGRFSDWGRPVAKDDHAPRVVNRVGWRRQVPSDSGHPDDTSMEYLILPNAFKSEVCAGFNYRAVAKLLAKRGYLKAESGGRLDPKVKPPGEASQRMYHVLPTIFDAE